MTKPFADARSARVSRGERVVFVPLGRASVFAFGKEVFEANYVAGQVFQSNQPSIPIHQPSQVSSHLHAIGNPTEQAENTR
jgi:hypothetical protein